MVLLASTSSHHERCAVVCFEAVLPDSLEVVFIVVTFGANAGRIPLAALGACAAIVVVTAAGFLVRGPLSRVPENQLKFVVGVLPTSLGMFWSGEGAGVVWPGAGSRLHGRAAGPDSERLRGCAAERMREVRGLADVVRDLVIGDDWRTVVGEVVMVSLIAGGRAAGLPVWWLPPVTVVVLLGIGVATAPPTTGRRHAP